MKQQFKNTKEPKIIQIPISLIHWYCMAVKRSVCTDFTKLVLKLDDFRMQFKQLLKLGEWVTAQSCKQFSAQK